MVIKSLDKNNGEYIDEEWNLIFEWNKKELLELKKQVEEQSLKYNKLEINELIDYVDSHQNESFKKERIQCEKYINEENNLSEEYDESIEIWSTEIIIESYEEFKLKNYSLDDFKNFILNKCVDFIAEENRKYLEKYNHPIDKNTLILKLKDHFDKYIRRKYNIENDIYDEEYYDNIDKIEENIDYIIQNHIENWWENFDENIINQLWDLLLDNQYLIENRDFRDRFEEFLQDKVKNFYNIFATTTINTWNDEVDLQLKSYLFLYWKIFFPEILNVNNINKWYDTDLNEILKIILYKYNPEIETQIKNKELLEQIKKAEQERREREIRRRQEAERRNREKNKTTKGNFWGKAPIQNSNKSKYNKKGADLVGKFKINLSDFSSNKWKNTDSISESMPIKHRAFRLARNNFIDSNDKIKDFITYSDMLKLYDIETNRIDEDARKSFLKTEIMKWRTNEEIKEIYEILKTFYNYFNDAIKYITNNISKKRWEIDEKVKTYALWSVIDNVKDTFDSIVLKWKWESNFEWFSFNSKEPVKREWNDIIILGRFNWAEIIIRYNLISGWLYMNSFIQYLSQSKITIWNNTNADYKIGQLESFDTILNEHYHTPKIPTNKPNLSNNMNRKFNELDGWSEWTQYNIHSWLIEEASNQNTNSPSNIVSRIDKESDIKVSKAEIISLRKRYSDMLNANIDLIGDTVINHTKRQSAVNSIITKFLRSFNIISDERIENSIDINDWSNMFDLIQIIENSDSYILEEFQKFMERIMEYSWLVRWKNNLLWPKINQKSGLIFDESNNNKYVSLLRNSSKDFSNNLKNLNWKLNFDSNFQLWFAELIINNLTNDISKPNRKLDISKMNNFLYYLENGNDIIE